MSGTRESESGEFVARPVDAVGPSFHVAEDLITTLVTLLIAQAAVPEIVHERLQLVFTDEYSMDANHFTALYDRMGDWAPRRLSLDPWDEGTCCEC